MYNSLLLTVGLFAISVRFSRHFMRKIYGTSELVFAQFEVRSVDDDIVQFFFG